MNLHVSFVLVPHKLAKLKAELLSIFYIIPENQLRWDNISPDHRLPYPVPDLSTEDNVNNNNNGPRFLVNSDDFLLCVQMASDAESVMKCILVLEDLFPERALFGYNPRLLPTVSSKTQSKTSPSEKVSIAAVGVRLFALDRMIKYEDIMVDLRTCGKFRPRTHFAPKCMFCAHCVKSWGHTGRCGVPAGRGNNPELFSRYDPIPDIGVDPGRITVPLSYPATQQGPTGPHANHAHSSVEARYNMNLERHRHSMGTSGGGNSRHIVPGSNYFTKLDRMSAAVSSNKRKSFINSDSEEEDEDGEDTDEESEDDTDDEEDKVITRYDIDHDDITPVLPRHDLIVRSGWI